MSTPIRRRRRYLVHYYTRLASHFNCKWVFCNGKFVATAVLMTVALSGCMSEHARYTEAAWQTLNVVDTGETITIARNLDCTHEDGYLIRGLIGPRPSERDVYLAMGVLAVVHYGVTALLDNQDDGAGPWHVANMVWQYGSIIDKGYSVTRNEIYGIHPWAGKLIGAR